MFPPENLKQPNLNSKLVTMCCTTCASSSLCFLRRADWQMFAALLQSPSTLRCQPLEFPLLAQYDLKAWHPAISGSACYACVFVSALRISDEPLIHPKTGAYLQTQEGKT